MKSVYIEWPWNNLYLNKNKPKNVKAINKTEIILGLGSNVGDAAGNLREALERLEGAGLELVRMASIYRTSPVGPQDQGWFANTVAVLRCVSAPSDLLKICKNIENVMGREQGGKRWGPRIIDIDILLYGIERVESEWLVIPHRELLNRLFVLVPLLELAPDAVLPDGSRVSDFAPWRIRELEGAGQRVEKVSPTA